MKGVKFSIGSIDSDNEYIKEKKQRKLGFVVKCFYFSSSIAFSTIANTSSTGSSEFIWRRREKSFIGLKREQFSTENCCESYFH